MVSSCKDLLLVSSLAAFIFLGLCLVRTHGDVIINHFIMFPSRSSAATVSTITTTITITTTMAVTVFATWIWKCREIKKKMRALDENKAALEQRLVMSERSLQDVVQSIANVMDFGFSSITRILGNQREQFRLDLEDVQTEMEKIREKLQVLERNIAECEERQEIHSTEEYLRDKQRLLRVQWQLERRKEELEQLQLNTERVLQSREAEGLKLLTERTMTLKTDMKQLHERLQQVETEREELQHSWCLIS
ncbi:hypothetical protein ABVT39_018599 [Epinephelus coioides]